ncbi:hypothetical protein TSUD_274400 [Trifolium subterraneum]|uniref:Transposase (putative) gypsy type domain-containing protein n=1 Tax=Trifolium subterraneum TaxID=3900 RepID=A0A2Z6MZK2_TRISU|nr:hypothetical protein TSUD_274400 [Trifolium subterraneum]
MVLLRELSGAKDYPLVIHHVGSDWERQVRAHYTRADGILNVDGYYSEMFGFSVKSSDFESAGSDSNSDSSGNDNDCVIISPSSFNSKNPNNRSLIVADSVATISTSMETSYRFISDQFVSTFRKVIKVSGSNSENHVMVDPVAEGEYVTTVNNQEPHYFYMYTHVLQTLKLWLAFTAFESQVLRVMNVAPCQLHPNSWTFMKAFEIACEHLEIVLTAGIFFCFFQVKNDTFVRFRCGEGCPELMFVEPGKPLFPFYWSSTTRLIRGTKVKTLNEYERESVKFLARFNVMGSNDLITREHKPQSLGEYMSSMSTLSAKERATLVLKEREQKAQAAVVATFADAMAQLLVEESEGHDPEEPLKRKKMPRNSGLLPPHSGGSSQGHADLEAVAKETPPFINCCPANPELKTSKKGNSPSSFWAKDFDSLSLVDEGFQRYVNPSALADAIDARNKMEAEDESLSSLEKEYAATKTKLEGGLKEMKAGRDEAVKGAVKAKEGEWAQERKAFVDEIASLKEKSRSLEEQLASATKERDEANSRREEINVLTTKVGNLELELGTQYDDRFKFVVKHMKFVFPEVEPAKLDELDTLNQIVDGKLVPYTPPDST